MPAAAARGARDRALGDEGALPDPRLGQAAAARFVVGAGDGGEVDIQRLSERAMGRQPLAAMQAARSDVGAPAHRRCFHRPGPAGHRV